ncbi:MAG: hypothetical protein GY822_17865, partial [Deltaproteobacteria bacterium]|nr:hypothetical protein [Deltaproteobacteria bacterium]
EWSQNLDNDDSAIDEIEVWLKNEVKTLTGDAKSTLKDTVTYIRLNKAKMRYFGLRKLGLPVGSGPTEGACKSLVGRRAKSSGQRWHNLGLDSVMALRQIHQSERFDGFWPMFQQEFGGEILSI